MPRPPYRFGQARRLMKASECSGKCGHFIKEGAMPDGYWLLYDADNKMPPVKKAWCERCKNNNNTQEKMVAAFFYTEG